MLIRYTKNIGGHSVGEIMDAPKNQAEHIISSGSAIPVEHGKDGRIIITRSTRKVPRRDRTVTSNDGGHEVH